MDEALLSEFPQSNDICYLNHAAVAPWPSRTATAVSRFASQNVSHGATYYPDWMKTEANLRLKIKALINADSVAEIALAKNTSEALSVIAYGIHWAPGDTVLITNQEFPSNRIVWESLNSIGVKIKQVDVDDFDRANQNIIDNLTEDVRLLSISAVQYASGLRLDLEAIGAQCKERNILFCIDAIQWIGALSFDAQKYNADFVVADGHKWMLGPEGLALFYIRQPLIKQLKLHQFGWHMVKQRGNYDLQAWEPAEDATRFECGSPNTLGAIALESSLGFLLEFGVDRIEAELQKRISYLMEALKRIPGITILSPVDPINRAGIVTFKVDEINHLTLHRALMQEGVICACRGGGIRFSPHFYTPNLVIDRALNILTQCISSQSK